MQKIGVLLTNIGTPSAATKKAVRRYLREFLSDKRIVHLPRLVWLPILYGLILPFRSKRVAHLYQKIWTDLGSPMRVSMQQIEVSLRDALQEDLSNEFVVAVGMNYGTPSISTALNQLLQQQIDRLIVLPLYPQYSNTTTASTFDRTSKHLRNAKILPNIHLIRDYATHPNYIKALAESVKAHWKLHGKNELLLISFHGIPKRFVEEGDIYQKQCEETAECLASELQLNRTEWQLCYQSQFGYAKWLTPSTQMLFKTLPSNDIQTIDIICPGFSVDCLETHEEIAIRGKELFLASGGKTLNYIKALNDSAEQIHLLKTLIHENY